MRVIGLVRAFLVIAVVLAGGSGCGQKKLTNVEYGNQHQVLYYGNGDEPKSLDPHITTGSPESNIILSLLEGLVRKDHKTLQPKPAVAESWHISEDGTVYTFTLRSDAKWSTGDPVTARDFVASWKRALMPTLSNEYAYMMFYVKNAEPYYNGKISDFNEVGVKAIDDQTLQVTLNYPAHFFLQVLDHHSYYPVHIPTLQKHGALDDPNSRWVLPGNFVGNGPFRLKKWEVNNVLEVVKSDTYWDKKNVHLNAIQFLPIEDKQAEERAFRSGRIHLTNTPQLDIEKIAVYKEKWPETLRITPTYTSYYYEFNTTRKPFDDARVRKAFAYAVDRKLLVERVSKGGEIPAYSLIPHDPQGYSPKQYFSYNVEKAKALLAEAGFPNGEGFPSMSLLYNTNDNHRKMALAIQQMLKTNLNVDIQLENKEWKVYIDAKKNLHHDFARAGWLADYLDASNFFDILRSYSGNNNTGWNSPEYDALMAAVTKESTSKKRSEVFERANKLLAEEMPILPIYYYADINLVHPSVKNWPDNVLHFHPFKHVKLEAQPE